jgi:hypothetical protein
MPGGAASKAPNPRVEPESTGVSGGFPGVIMRPEFGRAVTLVAPVPPRAAIPATSEAGQSIRFDGEYWLFRWPFPRPPSNARTFHGKPSAIFFRTTDRARLQMEARQRLDRRMEMRCCRGLSIDILNADVHPGTVTLEVALADSRRPSLQASLGSAPLKSVPDLRLERPGPVPETIQYRFPASTRLEEFDEIRVTFHHKIVRMDQSARVSIERFQFTR